MPSTKTKIGSATAQAGYDRTDGPAPSVGRLSAVPRRATSTQWRMVGRDTLVLHLGLKQYHVLNHVAGRIWDLCDGARSNGDIAAILADEFGVDESVVAGDVTDTVAGFETLGLLDHETDTVAGKDRP